MGTPSIGMAGLGMQAAGVGYSAMGAYNSAVTQRNALGYEARVSANNAAIAGYQADVAQQVGAQREQSSMLQTDGLFGAQRAALAANGVDLGQGSATDILATTRYMGARDASTIQDNTNRQVWGLRNEQASYNAEAQATLAARDAISPDRAALGSLLGGAGAFASSWYNYSRSQR